MDPRLVLELTAFGTPRRYQVRTTTAVQVAQMRFANELLYVVDFTALGRNAQGYVLQLDVLNAMQKADDLFSRVTADVNQATRKLVVQTDPQGNLLRVENQPEIVRAWEAIRKPLLAKYAAEPGVQPFLAAFEQKLAEPGSMENNLREKGLCGALLTGAYHQPYGHEPVLTRRCISGFFNDIDLPLLVATTATVAPPSPAQPQDAIVVSATASVDEAAFAATDFRRLMRGIVDDYTFAVDLQLTHGAEHLIDARTGELLRSRQQLSAEVAGIYHNTVTHEVFPQPTA